MLALLAILAALLGSGPIRTVTANGVTTGTTLGGWGIETRTR